MALKKKTSYEKKMQQSKTFDFLLKLHPELLTERNIKGRTLLHYAVGKRNLNMVMQVMHADCALIDMKDRQSETPLQYSIQKRFTKAVVAMLTHRPNSVNQTTLAGQTLVDLAIISGNLPTLSRLLTVYPRDWLRVRSAGGETPLLMAVRISTFAMVKMLVDASTDPLDIADGEGYTPVFIAAFQRRKRCNDMIRYFLHVCPHVSGQKVPNGDNLLHFISDVNIAKMLLKLNPNLINGTTKTGATVLHAASLQDDKDILQLYLQSKPELLLQRCDIWSSVLHCAFQQSRNDHCKPWTDAINVILTFKPDVIDTDAFGNTVLHFAVQAGNSEVIASVFANRMSNLYCKGSYGKTPMCLAVETNNRFAVRLFQPHMTIDRAIALRELCQTTCGIDLQQRCMQECESLNTYILPELSHLVFQYLGMQLSKKRKIMDSI